MANKLDLTVYRTHKLAYPLKDGEGKDITELHIRRAKVSDIKQMNNLKGSDVDKEVYMLALLTGLVPEDIEPMDIADYVATQKILAEMQKGK